MTAAVPVIDISGFAQGEEAARVTISGDVSSALEEIGFLVIQGHDVNPQTIAALREQAWRFFDLPLAEKMRSHKPIKGAFRGYVTSASALASDFPMCLRSQRCNVGFASARRIRYRSLGDWVRHVRYARQRGSC
jgi:isopenicillin N synthase-like dioxygenase